MEARVFDSALSAAARVAFSVTLVSGCSAAESVEATRASALTGPSPEPMIGAGATCTDAGVKDAAVPPTFTCSERGIQDLYVEVDADRQIDVTKVTPEVFACCNSLLDVAEAASELSPVWYECCYDIPRTTPDWDGPIHHRACTPWGPPVPPRMIELDMNDLGTIRAAGVA